MRRCSADREADDLLDHRQALGAGLDGREVRGREVLGKHDGLDRHRRSSEPVREVDEQIHVEGGVEGGHGGQDRPQRFGVEGLEPGLGVEHVGEIRNERGPDRVPEQHDDLVGLGPGADRLARRSGGLDEHRFRHPVALAERGDRAGAENRRRDPELGEVAGQVRVRVGDDVAPRHRYAQGVGEAGEDGAAPGCSPRRRRRCPNGRIAPYLGGPHGLVHRGRVELLALR